MSGKFEVGQDVMVTIYGKSRAGKVTDTAGESSNGSRTIYRLDDGYWYGEVNLKPLETKFKVGDFVHVYVPDWGLGSNETDMDDFVQDIKFSSVGTPSYVVRGKTYGEGWLSKPKNKFKVGDIVCPNWVENTDFKVTEVGFPGGIDSIKMTFIGREDNLSDIWMGASAYKLAPTSGYTFELGDDVKYVGTDSRFINTSGRIVGRGLTTAGTRYYSYEVGGVYWSVAEHELVPVIGYNAAGIKGVVSRVEKLEEKVFGVPVEYKVGDKVKVEGHDSTFVVARLSPIGKLNLKKSLKDTYYALVGVDPKDVHLYEKVDAWEEKPVEKVNLGDIVKVYDDTAFTVGGLSQGGSFNNYVTLTNIDDRDDSKMFRVGDTVEVMKNA